MGSHSSMGLTVVSGGRERENGGDALGSLWLLFSLLAPGGNREQVRAVKAGVPPLSGLVLFQRMPFLGNSEISTNDLTKAEVSIAKTCT